MTNKSRSKDKQSTTELQVESAPAASFDKNLRTKDYKIHLLERGFYTPKPNELELAWLNGSISTHCYRLMTFLLVHSDEFIVWRTTLDKAFRGNDATLKIGLDECLKKQMVIRFRKNNKTPFQYYVNPCNLWNLKDNIENDESGLQKSGLQKSGLQKSGRITRRTSNKKNENKNNDDEERAYDQTNGLDKKETSSSLEGENPRWESEYLPSDIVNALAEHGLIGKRKKTGFWVSDIKSWNSVAAKVWNSKSTAQISHDITKLSNHGIRLQKDAAHIMSLLSEINSSESKLERSKSIFKIDSETEDIELATERLREKNGGSLDDIPF